MILAIKCIIAPTLLLCMCKFRCKRKAKERNDLFKERRRRMENNQVVHTSAPEGIQTQGNNSIEEHFISKILNDKAHHLYPFWWYFLLRWTKTQVIPEAKILILLNNHPNRGPMEGSTQESINITLPQHLQQSTPSQMHRGANHPKSHSTISPMMRTREQTSTGISVLQALLQLRNIKRRDKSP